MLITDGINALFKKYSAAETPGFYVQVLCTVLLYAF